MINEYDWYMTEDYTILYLSQFDDWQSHPDIFYLTDMKHPGRIAEIARRVEITKSRQARRHTLAQIKRVKVGDKLHHLSSIQREEIPGYGLF